MTTVNYPSSAILSLSQQLLSAGIEPDVVEELLKSSYAISLKKGDTFNPSTEDALLIYFRSGCTVEVMTISDDRNSPSSVWTAGYITLSLPSEYNRFENQASHYHCLFNAELTIIPEAVVNKLKARSKALENYVLRRASEYLYTCRDMALLRYTLDKRENISLRLLILHIRTAGNRLPLTIDELCWLSNTTRQYCGDVLKQLQKDGVLEKRYGYIDIVDSAKLTAQIDADTVKFLSQYMPLTKK
ncbi:Crp/Fnr family transcriptional regulator [Ferrimonas lipolytica]|uniref:Crp/Fnr family transcriptional regulator n=1 Tax=Ferrimonas lipolytica TaxID=2724191 RepID=A0A6H1UGT9_9GAMM|nr:helix-turn-helix domain-containing protein [Ferrimonas lipolytica]QIZ78038.1 Crp/Fnr family transcriptional regulator [Ferrimonas lipolytica]